MEGLSLIDIQKNLREKKLSPKEVFDFFLKKIERHNEDLKAFLAIDERAFERDKLEDLQGPLKGIPLGVKDIFCTKDLKTTAGSRMLESYIPPYTATAVERLEQAGALIIGKCNNDEFAMGSTGENSYFGSVKNPWNRECSAGGSSSGSASAVAGGLCPASLGTDTGGSVRLPAHYCHLVGIKPTYGRVSRYGMIAYASSLDQAGIFSWRVEDGALLLDIMSGFDPLDSTTAKTPPPFFQKNLNSNIKDKKIVYFDPETFKGGIEPSILSAQNKALRLLKDRGCELIEKQWPFLEYGVSVYYLISTSEASSNLARYDGVRYGYRSQREAKNLPEFYAFNRSEAFGPEVRRRIVMGSFCLSAGYYEEYFHKACQVRHLIKQAFDEIFSECDVILSPVAGSPAPKLEAEKDPLQIYLNDQFTVFANLIGSPALSLPVSFSKENLPIGLQLLGRAFREQDILDVALALEEELQIYGKRPDGF